MKFVSKWVNAIKVLIKQHRKTMRELYPEEKNNIKHSSKDQVIYGTS